MSDNFSIDQNEQGHRDLTERLRDIHSSIEMIECPESLKLHIMEGGRPFDHYVHVCGPWKNY